MKINKQINSQRKKQVRQIIKYAFLILILVGIIPHFAFSQTKRSFIHGKIIDQSHIRSIISSTLIIYKSDKKVGEVTNGRGQYKATLLPGTYDLEVNAPGFYSLRKENVLLANGDSLKLDFNLKLNESKDSEYTLIVDSESHSQQRQELNAETSINDEIKVSPSIKAPSLTIKKNKKQIKKEQPTIAPAKYEIYRNKEAKSPFRYPVAKIPMVNKTDALENLIYNISEKGLPDSDKELKEIIIEELVNSLEYDYPTPRKTSKPFAVYTELFPCPWNEDKRLLHIGIQVIKLDSLTAISHSNVPVANNVNINVEFNPAYVTDYRLVGYEDYFPNLLSYRTDASMDATMNAGQCLTAIYEFTPTQNKFASEDQKLLYQNRSKSLDDNNELGAVQIFYRAPSARKTWKISHRINRFLASSEDIEEKTILAISLAEIAMRLKESPYIKTGTINEILKRIRNIEELSEQGNEILEMIETIQKLEATR